MPEELYVEEGTGLVRAVKYIGDSCERIALSDKPYEPNGKPVFVNPQTNFLEEGEPIYHPFVAWLNKSSYKKTSDFKLNGNPVIFHPERKEFAEVKPGYQPGSFDKVRNL